MNNKLIIAIDGPGAAGKSTVAKKVANKLKLTYIDTGAMYRSLALYVLNNNIDIEDVTSLVKAAESIDIFLSPDNKVFLNNEDVTSQIRANHISMIASKVSIPRQVREVLVKKQQELAKKCNNGVVMDGRDIGTVVLPNANLKIYQSASSKVRALRRYQENIERGILCPSLDIIEEEIKHRDYVDMHKEVGSLKKADDAIELDTSNMTIDEVVDFIYNKALEIGDKK